MSLPSTSEPPALALSRRLQATIAAHAPAGTEPHLLRALGDALRAHAAIDGVTHRGHVAAMRAELSALPAPRIGSPMHALHSALVTLAHGELATAAACATLAEATIAASAAWDNDPPSTEEIRP